MSSDSSKNSDFEEISLSAFQEGPEVQQGSPNVNQKEAKGQFEIVVPPQLLTPPCTTQAHQTSDSSTSSLASSFLPQMAALGVQSSGKSYRSDNINNADDDNSSIASNWSRRESSNSATVLNYVPSSCSSVGFESSSSVAAASSCGSSVISGFDVLNIDGSIIVRCHRCTFHNKEGSVICNCCEAALVANPHLEMDAQIARNLQIKEEKDATAELCRLERKRKELADKTPFVRAQALTEDIVAYVTRAATTFADSKFSTNQTDIIRALPCTDLTLLAASFIECMNQQEARVGPPVTLAYAFTSKFCESSESSEMMVDQIRKNGFHDHWPVSTNMDDAFAVAGCHNSTTANTTNTKPATTTTTRQNALYSIPEEATPCMNDPPAQEFLGWIVAIINFAEQQTYPPFIQPLHFSCSRSQWQQTLSSGTSALPLAYFDASRRNDPCIQSLFQGLSRICVDHLDTDWMHFPHTNVQDNNNSSSSSNNNNNNVALAFLGNSEIVESSPHKKLKSLSNHEVNSNGPSSASNTTTTTTTTAANTSATNRMRSSSMTQRDVALLATTNNRPRASSLPCNPWATVSTTTAAATTTPGSNGNSYSPEPLPLKENPQAAEGGNYRGFTWNGTGTVEAVYWNNLDPISSTTVDSHASFANLFNDSTATLPLDPLAAAPTTADPFDNLFDNISSLDLLAHAASTTTDSGNTLLEKAFQDTTTATPMPLYPIAAASTASTTATVDRGNASLTHLFKTDTLNDKNNKNEKADIPLGVVMPLNNGGVVKERVFSTREDDTKLPASSLSSHHQRALSFDTYMHSSVKGAVLTTPGLMAATAAAHSCKDDLQEATSTPLLSFLDNDDAHSSSLAKKRGSYEEHNVEALSHRPDRNMTRTGRSRAASLPVSNAGSDHLFLDKSTAGSCDAGATHVSSTGEKEDCNHSIGLLKGLSQSSDTKMASSSFASSSRASLEVASQQHQQTSNEQCSPYADKDNSDDSDDSSVFSWTNVDFA